VVQVYTKNSHQKWLVHQKKFPFGIGFRFLVKVSLCQISASSFFSVAQNLAAKLGPLKLSTGGSRSADDQTKTMGLDFELRKT
jgi:hypothetical protein